jgi:hypothetical protein
MNTEYISPLFLEELIKTSFHNKDVCEIVIEHVGYELIPKELPECKFILKAVTDHFLNTGKLPSVGMVMQKYQQNEKVCDFLSKLENIKILDKEDAFTQFEEYIRRAKFQEAYYKSAELYNSGKQADAIVYQYEQMNKIQNFKLKDDMKFEDLFENFEHRQEQRILETMSDTVINRKISFGIDALDALCDGGIDASLGETACFLARSGTGKSTFLRGCGIAAARRGFKVLHIQLEGSEEECLTAYDTGWSALGEKILKKDDIDSLLKLKLKKIVRDLKNKNGRIVIKAFEQFDTASYADVRKCILEYIKEYGSAPDLLIIDYTELLNPGDGKYYATTTEGEKFRREAGAKKLKNICIEFKMAGITASQTNDIAPAQFNDPDWYMTRHNVSGAKSLPNSFSFFLTGNMTHDEKKKKTYRIFIDKARRYDSEQLIYICTNFKLSRMYDKQRTIEEFSLNVDYAPKLKEPRTKSRKVKKEEND